MDLTGHSIKTLYHNKELDISPFEPRTVHLGLSRGLSHCGYDLSLKSVITQRTPTADLYNYFTLERIAQVTTPEEAAAFNAEIQAKIWNDVPKEVHVMMPGEFVLGVVEQYMNLPRYLDAKLHDKSTLARMGLAVQNTFLEPGWRGYLTLEISNNSAFPVAVYRGMPIGQAVFTHLTGQADAYDNGKYQDQPAVPVTARSE